jgi:hypothetical protein
MSDRLYQEAFLLNVCKLVNYIFDNGYTCTGGELFRTKEQAEIYASQDKGIVNSLHCRRLAIDLNLSTNTSNNLSIKSLAYEEKENQINNVREKIF